MVPYGIDKEKIFLQIERLNQHIKRLQELNKTKNTPKEAIERNLQLAIEDCIIIGNHLISGFSFKRPETYKGIFQVLEEERVINGEVAKEMMILVGVRNRLVHVYWEVKENEIDSIIGNLEIFDKFIKQIFSFLKKKGEIK